MDSSGRDGLISLGVGFFSARLGVGIYNLERKASVHRKSGTVDIRFGSPVYGAQLGAGSHMQNHP